MLRYTIRDMLWLTVMWRLLAVARHPGTSTTMPPMKL